MENLDNIAKNSLEALSKDNLSSKNNYPCVVLYYWIFN